MTPPRGARVACAILILATSAEVAVAAGKIVRGQDLTQIVPPSAALVEPYRNAGYEVRFASGAVEVEVDLSPLASSATFESSAAFVGASDVEVTARTIVEGATTQYEAVTRVLTWVRGNVRYDLDRSLAQTPEEVMRRGSGYCTGIARLSVALLRTVGIEAREVPGYVVSDLDSGVRTGFHRWIEVHYADRGWVFSDPLASQHFVPATYLRLAGERLEDSPGGATLLRRENSIEEVDLAPAAPRGVRVRPNDEIRTSAALVVRMVGDEEARAELSGADGRRMIVSARGEARFLGLEPGEYELKVSSGGRLAAWKSLVFRAPVLAELVVSLGADALGRRGR